MVAAMRSVSRLSATTIKRVIHEKRTGGQIQRLFSFEQRKFIETPSMDP
jgi:hypothetical protein